MRTHARKILNAALKAADPAAAVAAALELRRAKWEKADRIFVVGAGKAGGSMARAVEKVLTAKRIAASCVVVKDGDSAKTRKIVLHPAGHPVPDERGVAGATEIAAICSSAGRGDLVIFLLSGGLRLCCRYRLLRSHSRKSGRRRNSYSIAVPIFAKSMPSENIFRRSKPGNSLDLLLPQACCR